MPRRNKRKVQFNIHAPSIYDEGVKKECKGCAFAGFDFKCLSSDGKCLKIKLNDELDSSDSGVESPFT